MTGTLPRATIAKWALGGMVFGLLFPLCGTLVAGGGLAHAHRAQPVLYVVDLAPLVLGVAGAVIGVRTARLQMHGLDAVFLADRRLVDLENVNERLEHLIDARTGNVGRIAEELRLPIVVLESLIGDGAAVAGASEEHRRLAIEAEIAHLHRIVDDLWVAFKVRSGELVLMSDQFELSQLVRSALDSLEGRLHSLPALDLEAVPVFADAHRVAHVVRNLVVNADIHGGPNTLVRTLILEGEAVLEVRDDGSPLPDSVRNDVFEAYRTLGSAETGGGIGLGLTVSRALVREMGGELSYCHFGGWAIFRASLPMAPSSLRSSSGTEIAS